MGFKKYDTEFFSRAYDSMTRRMVVKVRLTRGVVGGIQPDDEGLRSYIKHHLLLEGDDAEQAFKRIRKEELVDVNVAPEEGELEERLTYGITTLRHSPHGPWLGDWMVKAMLKVAASRLGYFVRKRGSKGDVAEMGQVRALGHSLRNPANPEQIHIVDENGNPAKTHFETFRGRISGPKGSMSIVADKEVCPEGYLHFEIRWYCGKLTCDDMANILAASQTIGLGSCKSYERGKFFVEACEGYEPEAPPRQAIPVEAEAEGS